jgi:hypothetical protein
MQVVHPHLLKTFAWTFWIWKKDRDKIAACRYLQYLAQMRAWDCPWRISWILSQVNEDERSFLWLVEAGKLSKCKKNPDVMPLSYIMHLRKPNVMVACLRAGEALYSKFIIQLYNASPARRQAGNHNIGLPMYTPRLRAPFIHGQIWKKFVARCAPRDTNPMQYSKSSLREWRFIRTELQNLFKFPPGKI